MSNPDPIVIHLQAKDDGVNEVFDSATRATKKNEKAVKDTLKRMQDYRKTLGMTKQQLEIYRLEQNNATKEQIEAAKRIQRLTELKEKDIQKNKNLNGSLRMIRGGFGQVGHQIQDVAVQAQMGTDAFIILGQQGSQVASLCGRGGAMLRALLAVGAANKVGLTSEVADASQEVEEFVNKITEQRQELGMLSVAELAYQNILDTRLRQDVRDQTANYITELADLPEKLEHAAHLEARLRGARRTNNFMMMGMVKVMLMLNGTTDELNQSEEDLTNKIKENTEALKPNIQSELEAAEAEKERKKTLKDLVKGFEDQAEAARLSAQELARQQAITKGATQDDLDRIDAAFAAMDAEAKKQEAARKKRAEDKKAEADAERRARAEKKREEDLLQSLIDFSVGREGVLERTFAQELAIIQNASLEAVGSEERRNRLIEALRERHKQNLAKLEGKDEDTGEDADDGDIVKRIKSLQKLRDTALEGIRTERQAFEEAQIAKIAAVQAAADANIITETEKDAALRALRQADLENQLDAQLKLVGGLQHLEQSAEEAMMQFITQGQSASEAMRMLGRSIMDELLSSIIKMGIERVKQAVIAKQVESGALASSVMANAAAMAKIGAAAATPAALVATATAGGAAAAAATGLTSTVGLAQALAAAGGSFEGGGFTGTGSRSGGIDGRGGFPAILHPNETVIDHTRGQGQGITIINNIDASGNQDVDEKIAIAVTQSSRQTVEQVHNMMRRGRM